MKLPQTGKLIKNVKPMDIRPEGQADIPLIRRINQRAFNRDAEADLVEALRNAGAVSLSLVAEMEGQLVGHILYSPADIAGKWHGVALGPMAVLPEIQYRGIGTALVNQGNGLLRTWGCPFVIVLGHPMYYPRFGFHPASRSRVTCKWNVPDEAFMLLVLDKTAMRGASGRAHYHPEFDTVT
jgi:putative acetyltransferase